VHESAASTPWHHTMQAGTPALQIPHESAGARLLPALQSRARPPPQLRCCEGVLTPWTHVLEGNPQPEQPPTGRFQNHYGIQVITTLSILTQYTQDLTLFPKAAFPELIPLRQSCQLSVPYIERNPTRVKESRDTSPISYRRSLDSSITSSCRSEAV
jgi:hypothetical protein